jgi:hypothetical protein
VRYRYFVTLGIKIDGGQVLTLSGRLLGPLAEARAEMGEPTRHHRVAGPLVATAVTAPMLGPLALLGMASKKSKSAAFVTFANGAVHDKALAGNSAIRNAQREVVQFNAAAAAAPPANQSQQESVETPVRLACGHVAFITDPKIVRWLDAEGEKAYYCRTCQGDQDITATGPDALRPPEA